MTPACVGKKCIVGQCAKGFDDCDKDPSNGCEIDLNSDKQICGKCCDSCPQINGTATCEAGECVVTSCNAGYGVGDNKALNGCEMQTNSISNCGTCDTICGTSHATPTCVQGLCALACDRGYDNCDSNASNGCESNLTTAARAT